MQSISWQTLLACFLLMILVLSAPSAWAGTCLTSSLSSWAGKARVMVGAMMEDTVANSTPFDMRYQYLAGQFPDQGNACNACSSSCTVQGSSCTNSGGCNWWGCWQWDQLPPGQYARDLVSKATARGQIPIFTYYTFVEASGVSEGAAEISKANDTSFMKRYFNDFRFLLKQIGSAKAIVHVEPDFWGEAQKVNSNPAAIAAAVAKANSTDCSSVANTIAGFGQCLIKMARKYAPNAKLGFHASPWSISLNRDPSYDIEADGRAVANFLKAVGGGDLVVADLDDRDAGYHQAVEGRNLWWDATNATLPNYAQYLRWVKALTVAMQKPALLWQVPIGNAAQNNAYQHWKDNRVAYFFAHMADLATANVAGIAYGAGADDQTNPSTDGGVLIAKAKAYVNGGGTAACQP